MNTTIDKVKTDKFEMAYCSFGRGDRTLVVIPGLSVQAVTPLADAIAAQYECLTEDFTVYVFDRRKEVPAGYTVADMAEDTVAAMRELELGRVSIFGASQGGMIAMLIAGRHPELVDRLILGSTCGHISDEAFGIFDGWIALAKSGRAEELYLSFGEAVYTKEVFEGAKDVLKEASKTVTEEELAHFVVITEGTRGFDASRDLDKIECPVLVIGSEDDRVLGGEASRQIAAALKGHTGCGLHMYDGYGHAAYDCAPDYQQRMLAFLND